MMVLLREYKGFEKLIAGVSGFHNQLRWLPLACLTSALQWFYPLCPNLNVLGLCQYPRLLVCEKSSVCLQDAFPLKVQLAAFGGISMEELEYNIDIYKYLFISVSSPVH